MIKSAYYRTMECIREGLGYVVARLPDHVPDEPLPHQRMWIKSWIEIHGMPGFPTVHSLNRPLTNEDAERLVGIFDQVNEDRQAQAELGGAALTGASAVDYDETEPTPVAARNL